MPAKVHEIKRAGNFATKIPEDSFYQNEKPGTIPACRIPIPVQCNFCGKSALHTRL